MNFQYTPILTPLRVMIINPLIPASQLTITKMLSGIVFGINQLLDMILLVYSSDLCAARQYIQELISSAFPCFNSIRATSDLPSITDADVFCFMTTLTSPDFLDSKDMDNIGVELFDTLYLMIKIAHSLGKPAPVEEPEKGTKKEIHNNKKISPVIIADGIVVMDILWSISKNLPPEIFFCTTPLRSLSKTLLSDHLKVECHQINYVYAWAANDKVFHVEIQRPYIVDDKLEDRAAICNWDAVGQEMQKKLGQDHLQFNASWMKREFIKKIEQTAAKNPYGCMYKAAEMSKTLRYIWNTRYNTNVKEFKTTVGVISDGSLGTIKGIPYVFPVIFNGDKWTVDKAFEDLSHVKRELKRINIAAQEHHKRLVPYCKRFLDEHVINKRFLAEIETPSEDSFTAGHSNSTRSDVF